MGVRGRGYRDGLNLLGCIVSCPEIWSAWSPWRLFPSDGPFGSNLATFCGMGHYQAGMTHLAESDALHIRGRGSPGHCAGLPDAWVHAIVSNGRFTVFILQFLVLR